LAAGLDGKVVLSKANLALSRVPILSDQGASVAIKMDILYHALAALTNFDHVGGINEMIVGVEAHLSASELRFLDYGKAE
jgi:hypothetical protein